MLPSGSLSLASLGICCSLARPQQALGAEGNKLLNLRGMLLVLGVFTCMCSQGSVLPEINPLNCYHSIAGQRTH